MMEVFLLCFNGNDGGWEAGGGWEDGGGWDAGGGWEADESGKLMKVGS